MRTVCGAPRRGSVEEGVSLRGARRMRREASVDEAWEKVLFTPLGRNDFRAVKNDLWVARQDAGVVRNDVWVVKNGFERVSAQFG